MEYNAGSLMTTHQTPCVVFMFGVGCVFERVCGFTTHLTPQKGAKSHALLNPAWFYYSVDASKCHALHNTECFFVCECVLCLFLCLFLFWLISECHVLIKPGGFCLLERVSV